MNQHQHVSFRAIVGNIMEKQKEEGIFGGVDRRKLEEALTAKQESDAKLSSIEFKNRELTMELTDLKAKVCCLLKSIHVQYCCVFLPRQHSALL